ncbi:MAG: Ig-like domain-containing protein [Planctomycetaceae bacterium]
MNTVPDPEFQVNTTSNDIQRILGGADAVGVDDDDNYTIVWESRQGGTFDVYAADLAPDGTPLSNEFRVNQTVPGSQFRASISMNGDGNFVVTWNGPDANGEGIYARLYNSLGTPLTNEFRVNQNQNNAQVAPSVRMDQYGNFVVAWQSSAQDGSGYGIYARRFNAQGTPLSSETRLNATTTTDQSNVKLTMLDSGDFVATWITNQNGRSDIYARRFNANLSPIQNEFRVNTTTTFSLTSQKISSDGDGNFVITWTSNGQDGSGYGIYGRRFNSSGTALSGEFRVNQTTAGWQEAPSIAMHDDGSFVVAWQGPTSTGTGTWGRCYDAAGSPISNEFLVDQPIRYSGGSPSVILDNNGGFIFVWTKATASSLEVAARHYRAVNSPPVAENVIAGAIEDGGPVIVPFNADDEDSDDTPATLIYDITSAPAEGSVANNGDGSFTFNPGSDFQDLAVGEMRNVSFQYTATDSHGAVSNSALVTITVTGVNDNPTANDVVAFATEDGGPVTGSFDGDDVDSNNTPATLFYDIISAPSAGSVVNNLNGTFTFNPGSDFQDLAVGETRQVGFQYTATDSHSAVSNTALVTITVTGVNDAPTANAVFASATEDGGLIVASFGSFDVDNDGYSNTFTHQIITLPTEGTVINNGERSFYFDPGNDFQDLAVGETRDVSFQYRATDSHGAISNTAVVTITVTGVNDDPIANAVVVSATEDGSPVVASFDADDVDSDDTPATLTYDIISSPTEGSVANNGDGTFTFNPGSDFQDLAVGDTRDVSFQYTATDSHDAVSNTAVVTITVTGVNDDPSANAIVVSATEDGSPVVGSFDADDVDNDDTPSTLIYDIISTPAEGTVINNGDGTFSFNPGSDFQDLAAGETRDVSFQYTATDSHSAISNTALVKVSVTGVNDLHEFTALMTSAEECGIAGEGDEVLFNATFSDIDLEGQYTATIHWGDGYSETVIAATNETSGSFSGGHVYNSGGIYSITVNLTDDAGNIITSTTSAIITGVGVQDDTLYVIGTNNQDAVNISRTFWTGNLYVYASFLPGFFHSRTISGSSVSEIVVLLCDGHDTLNVATNVSQKLFAYGGSGNDSLNAGGGPSVLWGGAGHDFLRGGTRNDILIGGDGKDTLIAAVGSDLLLTGSTLYDPGSSVTQDFTTALDAILEEWNAPGVNTSTRKSNIESGTATQGYQLDSSTVFNDLYADKALGSSLNDWVLADSNRDWRGLWAFDEFFTDIKNFPLI